MPVEVQITAWRRFWHTLGLIGVTLGTCVQHIRARMPQVSICSPKRDDLEGSRVVIVGKGKSLEACVGPAEGGVGFASELCRGSLVLYATF